MNKLIEEILHSHKKKEEKIAALNIFEKEIFSDIEFARKIINGEYKYCEECKDYYLTKSFLGDSEKKKERICIYEDPINSGGNEYEDGYVLYTYEVCPKGHRKLINRSQCRR